MRKPSASMEKMSTSGSSLSSSATVTLILSTRTDCRAPTTPSARRRRSLVISTTPAAGEGGAVVDAVAHHAHRRLLLEVLDGGELLLRLHAGVAVGNAHAGAHRLGRLGAVARQHDGRDLELLERAHRLRAVGAHAVGEAAHRRDLAVEHDPQHAAPVGLPLGGLRRVERQLGLGRCAARAGRAAVVHGDGGRRLVLARGGGAAAGGSRAALESDAAAALVRARALAPAGRAAAVVAAVVSRARALAPAG